MQSHSGSVYLRLPVVFAQRVPKVMIPSIMRMKSAAMYCALARAICSNMLIIRFRMEFLDKRYVSVMSICLVLKILRDKKGWFHGRWRTCLVWYGYSVSEFFDYGKYLLQFAEVLEYGYASLGYCVDDSSLADCSFFHEVLFDQEVQVLFEDAAVNVGFIHDVSEL